MSTIISPTLTRAQRAILARAIEQTDGVCIRPKGITRRDAQDVAQTLLALKFVRAINAKAERPSWYADDAGRPLALIITRRGRDAVHPAPDKAIAPIKHRRQTASDQRSVNPSLPLRADSKIAQVIHQLNQEAGASLRELMTLTGWLPHTTRAAMTGLRKRGYTVVLERGEQNIPVYRITSCPVRVAQVEAA